VDDLRPRALVSTGGYAAGVALAVASRRRLPIVIQAPDSFPGITIRYFARRATQVHLGFPEARARLRFGRDTQVFVDGNPIDPPPPAASRPLRADVMSAWGFDDPARPVVLVTGGSQGSAAINAAVAAWLDGASDDSGPYVIWATGPTTYDLYRDRDSARVRVRPYIAPMRDAYSAATIAISRAGAMTTAELSAWGLPSILIPLPTAAADHQTLNARAIAADGAAIMLPQASLDASVLSQAIGSLLGDQPRLDAMREATLRRARPNAAQDIAAHILAMPCFK
jgi:UDP-N-acetylglucosamine--N-acetylmuramyl-(pentapeptide) pyrophosphoryl-undecaprenol N-acetylglucosamine transferase